jgi:nucleoside-diphosphate-sugar epimerase
VYGAAGEAARTEESPVAPLTAYARSKVLAEQDLRQLAAPGFRVTSLRFATACGMSDRLRLDLVLNDFVAAALSEKTIRILSDGTPWRPLIHVRDMARAIEWAIGRDGAAGDFLVVNAGADEWNYQVRELAAVVAKVISGVEIWVNPEAVPDRRSYRVSFERFRQLAPGHLPAYDLVSTVAELADGLRRLRFSDAEFRSSAFIRLNVLAALRAEGLLDEELLWTVGQDDGRG